MPAWEEIIRQTEFEDPSFEDEEAVVSEVIVIYEVSHFDGSTSFGMTFTKGMTDPKRYGLLRLCTEKESHDIMEGWLE
jgi:hypothetical protein